MPLPLGHSAIGFATHSLITAETGFIKKWKLGIMIVVLSNLPDIDVIFGLVLHNNGSIFHRGPTHSILFALVLGIMIHYLTKRWDFMPAIHFKAAFLLIFSHVMADFLFTDAPVSFFWPLEVRWADGNAGWGQVFHSVFFDAGNDLLILVVCILIVTTRMLLKRAVIFQNFKRTLRS